MKENNCASQKGSGCQCSHNKSEPNEKGFLLPKSQLSNLFTLLQEFGEVIAPRYVKSDEDASEKQDEQSKDDSNPSHEGMFLRMAPTENIEDVVWEGVSWFTSKKYTFPAKQTLLSFSGRKVKKWNKNPKKRVLFGLRLCDLNAFAINDQLFLKQEPKMPFYEKFRKNLLLVGFWCDSPQDKYCFCDSMDLKHIYDLCLFDKGEDIHIKVGSQKGEEIIKKLALKTDNEWREAPKCTMQLQTTDIKKFFDKNEVWKKGEKDCLSCGDCTSLCPTCLCFDIEDETNVSGTCGERCAKWDSCMFKDFTLVAGGEHFRGERIDRFKHRIYHKLQYFKEDFDTSMCTGCGRCIRGCPTKIDWISLINEQCEDQ